MQKIVADKSSDKNTANNVGQILNEDVSALKNMAHEAKSSQSGGRTFMDPKSKTEGKKRGPYKKGPTPTQNSPNLDAAPRPPENVMQQQPLIPGKEIVKPFINVISAMFGRASNQKLKFEPQEIDDLCLGWGAVYDKRSGPALKEYEDIMLAVSATLAVGMRMGVTYQGLKAEYEKRQKAETDKNSNVTPITPNSTP